MATSRETKKFVDSAGVTKIYQTFKSDLQTAVGVIDQAKANTSHTHVMADITDFSGGGGVGQDYKVGGVKKGEIFNDYTLNEASGNNSHTEGNANKANGASSHAQGAYTRAFGTSSFSGGSGSTADGISAFAFGVGTSPSTTSHWYLSGAANTTTYTVTGDTLSSYLGMVVRDKSSSRIIEQFVPVVSYSSANQTVTLAETLNPNEAWTNREVTFVFSAYAKGNGAFAFGSGKAIGNYAIIMGSQNRAEANYSIAMGFGCRAAAQYSAAIGGYATTAGGSYSFATGYGTIAYQPCSAAFGKYNVQDDTMLFQVGYGSSASSRLDLFNVDTSGNATIAGNTTIGGNLTVNGELIVPSTAGTSVNSMWIV